MYYGLMDKNIITIFEVVRVYLHAFIMCSLISMVLQTLLLLLMFESIYGKLQSCIDLDDEDFDNLTENDYFAYETEDFPAICDTTFSYNKVVPPPSPNVTLGICIYEITDINDRDYTISISISLFVSWKDNRTELSFTKWDHWDDVVDSNIIKSNFHTISLR